MNVEQFLALKKQKAEWQRKADEASGSIKALLDQLKSEFGVKDLEGAEALVKKLAKEEQKLERVYDNSVEEWRKKWERKL